MRESRSESTSGPDGVEASELPRIAWLHVDLLPDTAIAKLGVGYAQSFYRWVLASPMEHLFVCRDDGEIVAVAVLSLSNASLTSRLWRGTPLGLHLLSLIGRSGFVDVSRAVWPSFTRGRRCEGRPAEVISLFTQARNRRRGLASTLLARVERFLRELGHDRYVVRTASSPGNPALEFYLVRRFSAVSTPASGVVMLEKRLENLRS